MTGEELYNKWADAYLGSDWERDDFMSWLLATHGHETFVKEFETGNNAEQQHFDEFRDSQVWSDAFLDWAETQERLLKLGRDAQRSIENVRLTYGSCPLDDDMTDTLADLFVYLLAHDKWGIVESARVHAEAEIYGDEFTSEVAL
jgi:hypothetical protein